MAGSTHTGRVIFVDDDASVRRVVGRMLRLEGWAVDEAADGAECLALFDDERPPDVVLTDLRMPGMDGVALVEALKRRAPAVPVIVMTASTEIASASRAVRAGAVDYLTKPIEMEVVARALAHAVDRARLDAEAHALRWQREITAALADAHLDIGAICETLTRRTAESIGDLCALHLLSDDGKMLHLGAFYHRDAEARAMLAGPLQQPYPLTESLVASDVLATNRLLFLQPDSDAVRRYWEARGAFDYQERYGLETIVLAPLRGRGATLGVFGCSRGRGQRPYGERERMLVQDLADRAALAIQNARLHAELQEQLRHTAEAERSLRKTEERLAQAQRAEALGRLAGGVAHDFNNILSVMIGYAELLLEEEALSETGRARVDGMLKAALHGAALTGQLLAFGRKQVLEPRIVDLNETVRSMEDLLVQVVRPRVELSLDLAPDLGRVRVDPAKIQQVLMNLVINARDAMPGGGRVTIRTTNESPRDSDAGGPSGRRAGGHAMLAVSDTGIGMDAATAARIFEPFFTTKAAGKGTGLGLSTVLGVVEQSGGHIEVDSQPGAGATFRVYFPHAQAEPRRKTSRPRLTAVHGAETILLVDDDPDVRALTARFLERAGYTVLAAASAAEARDLAERAQGTIALLVTDVVMPGESGIELAREIYRTRPEMRVLYVSTDTRVSSDEADELPEDAAFLQKPIARDALLSKVRSLLDAARTGP